MSSEPEPRRVGGRYRLGEQLGRGGMGVVWAAVDERLGRDVAVKEVIPPSGLTAGLADATRQRSLREARAAARITSDSAVRVFDVVEDDGRPWIVMERLDAQPLSEIIDSGRSLTVPQVADIAARLLDAITAAHTSGVLHRDVKPSNVMIGRDGRVVLTDFGIAALDGDPSITTTGVLIGSPAYIAPERALGDPASAASDMWSLGCTLYAALEGRPPFDGGTSMGTLTAVITQPPPPALSAGPLAAILDGLLRKDPAQRLTAADTQRMLRSLHVEPTRRIAAAPAGQRPHPTASGGGRTTVLPVLPRPVPPAPDQSSPPPVRTPAPPPALPPRRPRPRSWRLPAAIAAVLVVLALGAVALVLGDRGGEGGEQAQPPSGRTSAGGTQSESPSSAAPTTQSSTTTASTTTTEPAPADGVPEGFTRFEDPTGFAIAVPDGWEVVRDGPRVDFVEPGGGRFLRVDQTDTPQPDPVADWEQQAASAAQRLPGYTEIGIEQVEYRDYDAADWEFTWTPEDGPPLHVLNRNLITAPDQAYALYWSVPDEQWEDNLDVFEVFAESFEPDA